MGKPYCERKFFIHMLSSSVELGSAAIEDAQLRLKDLLMIWRFPIGATGLVLTVLVLSSCYGPLDWFDGPRPEGQPMPPPIVAATPTPCATPTPTHTSTPCATPLPPQEPEELPTKSSDSENDS